MFIIKLLVLNILGCVCAHSISRAPTNGDSINGTEAKLTMRKVVKALGGPDALNVIDGFTYTADDIYRSWTLTQSYNLYSLDQSVATAGSQTMSFQTNQTELLSRVDRAYDYNEYWLWAYADLKPTVNMSFVIRDTLSNPYACFVQGSNNFFSPNLSLAQGYADGLLTDYLIHHSRQFGLPWLLRRYTSDSAQLQVRDVEDPVTMARYVGLEHAQLGLTLLVDSMSYIPYAVRSNEHHEVYGLSTSDVVLTKWSRVPVKDGEHFLLPHRLQTIYNSIYVLEDFLVNSITINPDYPASFFEGHAPTYPKAQSLGAGLIPMAPTRSNEYPRSEVHEYFETGLWAGPFGNVFNESNVVVGYPYKDFHNIMSIYIGYPDYVQLLVEHKTGFIITDAPRHRSKIILQWLATNRPGKRITHVVPSHHHRDHAGGVEDYLLSGSILVVPEVAKDFYSLSTRNHTVVTYDAESPFIFDDGLVEFRSFWSNDNPHAEDWTFAVATKSSPTDNDPFVLFNADVVNPGTPALKWDSGSARDFLIDAVRAGVPKSTLLVGAHGSSAQGTSTSEALSDVASTVGFPYPMLNASDWTLAKL